MFILYFTALIILNLRTLPISMKKEIDEYATCIRCRRRVCERQDPGVKRVQKHRLNNKLYKGCIVWVILHLALNFSYAFIKCFIFCLFRV